MFVILNNETFQSVWSWVHMGPLAANRVRKTPVRHGPHCWRGVPEQAAVELPPEATFEEYLAMSFEEDEVSETYIDPLSLKGAPKAVNSPCEVVPAQPFCLRLQNWLNPATLSAARRLPVSCWAATPIFPRIQIVILSRRVVRCSSARGRVCICCQGL